MDNVVIPDNRGTHQEWRARNPKKVGQQSVSNVIPVSSGRFGALADIVEDEETFGSGDLLKAPTSKGKNTIVDHSVPIVATYDTFKKEASVPKTVEIPMLQGTDLGKQVTKTVSGVVKSLIAALLDDASIRKIFPTEVRDPKVPWSRGGKSVDTKSDDDTTDDETPPRSPWRHDTTSL